MADLIVGAVIWLTGWPRSCSSSARTLAGVHDHGHFCAPGRRKVSVITAVVLVE
jgi:hypothetical protein